MSLIFIHTLERGAELMWLNVPAEIWLTIAFVAGTAILVGNYLKVFISPFLIPWRWIRNRMRSTHFSVDAQPVKFHFEIPQPTVTVTRPSLFKRQWRKIRSLARIAPMSKTMNLFDSSY